ncbi:MAG: hypothetical protein WA875_03825 [Candidatus Acidiferrales bacterium]
MTRMISALLRCMGFEEEIAMPKPKTVFEQVPLKLVAKVAEEELKQAVAAERARAVTTKKFEAEFRKSKRADRPGPPL